LIAASLRREAISSTIKQPIRFLVSSTFHDNYSKGNLAHSDVFKIGHKNYRAGFLEQLQRGGASVEEQRARLPNQTFRNRVTLDLGGKEIQVLYLAPGTLARRQHHLRTARPDRLFERAVFFGGIPELGAGLWRFMATRP
jgi:hypothetical protein